MKTLYLSVLTFVLLAGGCCKCPPANTAATTTGSSTSTASGVTSGQPTTAMIVPGVTSGVAGDISITMSPMNNPAPPPPTVCNRIHIFVCFMGTTAGTVQSVTIPAVGGNPQFVFADQNATGATIVQAGTFGSPPAVLSNLSGAAITASIQARVGGNPYTAVSNGPQQMSPPANKIGLDVTTYSDGAGHQVTIVIEDEAIMQ